MKMINKDYLNLIGLAYRARKCSLGEKVIVKDIQERNAKLVILANDTGFQTRKKITDKCNSYNIPLYILDDRETLGNAVGKTERVAIAILDDGFATKLMTLLE